MKEFWEAMQAWVGASPYKSAALAAAFFVLGAVAQAMVGG